MKFILIALTLALAGPGLMACSKYKMVNVEEDEKAKAEEAEKMAMELKEKMAKEAAEKEAAEKEKEREEQLKEQEEKIKELEEKLTELDEKKDDKTKVVVVRDKSPSSSGSSDKPAGKPKGWVRLYDDKGFTDRQLTIGFGRNIGNFHNISSDDGKSGFNDKASAVKFNVPPGWKAVLYENSNYSKRAYPLKGRGAIADLGYFGDKASSIRWERN